MGTTRERPLGPGCRLRTEVIPTVRLGARSAAGLGDQSNRSVE